tara:strand:- start:594 stop:3215 length:2622 start_codon:yes stop_codon:yes gene_type:complete
MHKLLLPFLVMLSTITSQAFAGDSCKSTQKTHLQCVFEIPLINDGESVVVDSIISRFSGEVTASCYKGKLTVNNKMCGPSKPSSCSILSSVWSGKGGSSCSHKQEKRPIANGATSSIPSSTGNGEIKYQCKSGSLQILEKTCIASDTDDAILTTAETHHRTSLQDVIETSCDTAHVFALMGSEYNVRSGEFDIKPSRVRIKNELCSEAGYRNMVTFSIDSAGSIEDWVIEANCESKIENTCDSACIGREVDKARAIAPTICRTFSGVETCYENTCATPEVPTGFCANCPAGIFSYQGDNTGNTCNVDLGELISSDDPIISFSNSSYNGSVKVFCNSGQTSKVTGTCYKTCSGGTVSWDDDYGQKSCGQTVPSGSYFQGETVSVTSALHHGGAEFKCNDGTWENVSGSCILDCDGSFSWGSGTSVSGLDKSNACNASVGFLEHDTQSVAKVSSTAIGTDGDSHYSCDNGILTPSSGSCDLNCTSQTVSWASLNCSGTAPAIENTNTKSVNTSSWLVGYTGNAEVSCSDGSLSLSGTGNCYSDCASKSFGVDECSVSLPSGKHGAVTEFYDLDKEGSYICDDGNWKTDDPLICLAGFSGCGSKTMNWGGGCSGRVSNERHGVFGTALSTVGSGESGYRCDNGVWESSGVNTCDVGCSGTVSWGDGNACSAEVSSLANGVDSKYASTTSLLYRWERSANATCYKNGVMSTVRVYPYGSCSASQLGEIKRYSDRDILSCPYRMESVEIFTCKAVTVPSSGLKISSTSINEGSAYYSCNNGVFGTSDASCSTGCPTKSVTWNVSGATCSADLPVGDSGDTYDATVAGAIAGKTLFIEGAQSYKCEGASWKKTGTNSYCVVEDMCGVFSKDKDRKVSCK